LAIKTARADNRNNRQRLAEEEEGALVNQALVNEALDHLKSLHTSAIDARNGYQEALKDAEGNGMTPLFRDMMALHDANAGELARELTRANELPDENGSFMTVVHKTIMDVRSLFNGLDESVLPGLIDGEKRNVSKYDEALQPGGVAANVASVLVQQRDRLLKKIALMEARTPDSESVA
jgi:uncharacterized protein (TIGR02284 family)